MRSSDACPIYCLTSIEPNLESTWLQHIYSNEIGLDGEYFTQPSGMYCKHAAIYVYFRMSEAHIIFLVLYNSCLFLVLKNIVRFEQFTAWLKGPHSPLCCRPE